MALAAALRGSLKMASSGAAARAFSVQPFHLALPVHNLEAARKFYGDVFGFEEGRSSKTWIDWNMGGHQLVTHFVSDGYRGVKHINGVDKDMVPVPHFGICLDVEGFQALAARLKEKGVTFLIEPHLRWPGQPGAQWTMFLEDPSGNSLEFKAMVKPENLFAKYYVDE